MAKDAKGHGSERAGTNQKLFDALGRGMAALRPGMYGSEKAQAANDRRISDTQAAGALAQGGAKSEPVPIHGGATGRTDPRVAEAQAAMGRLKDTFKTGDNRHGSYGDNVRGAYERHAANYEKLTGKKAPHIYD